jgi:hypothetical protein
MAVQTIKWLLIAALTSAVGRANAEATDCPEPTPHARKVMRDRKLEEWKRGRRKEAAGRGELVSHSMLVVTDDGRAVVQEQARTSNGCQARYFRVTVSTSACESDSLNEDEFYVGCCVPRGCTSPTSFAYAFVDAVTLEQSEAVRRFLPEGSALTIADEQGQIRPYRRTEAAPRFKEMMKSLPRWTPGGEIDCAQPKRASGKYESECSLGGGGSTVRFVLTSSSGDLTDDKMVWFVARVELDRR